MFGASKLTLVTGSYIENRGEEIINDPWYDEWEVDSFPQLC